MIARLLRALACAAGLAVAWAGQAGAQTLVPQTPAGAALTRANSGAVGVVSGGVNGTYIRIAADLAAVLDNGENLRVLPIIGKGSVQNIADILFLRGVDIGIVQSDALAYVRRQNLFPGADQSLQYITKLYDEEVHILARKEIEKLEDLADRAVNVDVRGSGTAMTATVLFESLGIPVKPANEDQDTALEKLKRGDIDALVYVTGQPARLFSGIGADSGLHFLAVPMTQALLETYLPTQIEHSDYPALVPEGAPVDTLAVGAVMAVFGWQPGTERYRRTANFTEAFFGKFQKFLEPPHHPKWKEVNLAAQVPGWTRFAPARDWLARQNALAASADQRDFNAFLSSAGPGRADLSPAQREALFQQFLNWQSRQRRGNQLATPR
jgi:TRAP transporter TAXI family solute receptor